MTPYIEPLQSKSYALEDTWELVPYPEINPTESHIIPQGELHNLFDCSCCPNLDLEDPSIIIHNSFDRREYYASRYLFKS